MCFILEPVAPDTPTEAKNITVSSRMHGGERAVLDPSTSRVERVSGSTWRVTTAEELSVNLCVFTSLKYQMSECYHVRHVRVLLS